MINFFRICNNSYWLKKIRVAILTMTSLAIFASCQSDMENLLEPSNGLPVLDRWEEMTALSTDNLKDIYENAEEIKYPVKLYKITYHTPFKGSDILASGVIILPETNNSPFPIVSFQHGTITNEKDAPSNFSLASLNAERSPIETAGLFGSAGYITFLSDYIGFGESKEEVHPFYNKEFQSSANRNMIQAGIEFLTENNISFDPKLFLYGYSEGGYSTLVTQKTIEENPFGNLKLAHVAAGAGGYNIDDIVGKILDKEENDNPSFLAQLVYSYHHTMDFDQPIFHYFQDSYALEISDLFNGSHTLAEINEQLPTNPNNLFKTDFLSELKENENSEFKKALKKNNINDWSPNTPLMLLHSPADEIIPFENSQETYDRMISNGAGDLTLYTLNGDLSHAEADLPAAKVALQWFNSYSEE
ncbi:alpha/beta hydrolase family protein [Xanthovirga aplysinae]|uniref:alpha/beta hydrolase family protein n=1 Tax=Xanthovirga aplysinae TaxID=2529853 RepID=UPI0012BD0710|nr:lipase family protein [Xanthovirga aplysinae]MTI29532.1 hypothetical protein [Xanthovirga aplysinae]